MGREIHFLVDNFELCVCIYILTAYENIVCIWGACSLQFLHSNGYIFDADGGGGGGDGVASFDRNANALLAQHT